MADLNAQEKMKFKVLLKMDTGYVHIFTNNEFRDLILNSVDLDIYSPKYEEKGNSKAKRLRAFWEKEPNEIVGKVLIDILEFIKLRPDTVDIKGDLYLECVTIANRLAGRDKYGDLIPQPLPHGVFISYQSGQRPFAEKVKALLEPLGIDCFLAYQDIELSDEWKDRLLLELKRRGIFLCLLTEAYYESVYCVQESGIAAYRKNTTIIPLSLDGSKPKGLISNRQSVPVSGSPDLDLLAPALFQHDLGWAIDRFILALGKTSTYAEAERSMQRIFPYLDDFSEKQGLQILEHAFSNDQIHAAQKCAADYLPPIIEEFGDLLESSKKEFLDLKCEKFSKKDSS